MSSAATTLLNQVDVDFNTIVSNGQAVIQRVETDALADVAAGYAWLKGELEKLEPTVLAALKTDVQKALQDALAGGTGASSIVSDVLTLLAGQGSSVLTAVESNVLVAFISFVTTTVATL